MNIELSIRETQIIHAALGIELSNIHKRIDSLRYDEIASPKAQRLSEREREVRELRERLSPHHPTSRRNE